MTKKFKVYNTEKDYITNKYPGIKNISVEQRTIYILPGGISSVNESIYDTLRREIYEETKLVIDNKNINTNTTYVKVYDKELNKTFYNAIYEYTKPFTFKTFIENFKCNKEIKDYFLIPNKNTFYENVLNIQQFIINKYSNDI